MFHVLKKGKEVEKTIRAKIRKDYTGYFFISPAVFLIILFTFVSLIFSLYLSFHKWDLISAEKTFVGLENYKTALFDDRLFWIALKNTLYYVANVVPLITIGAVFLAIIANEASFGKGIFRTIYFIPWLTPMVIVSYIWLWLYEPKGVINIILGSIGLPQPNWLMNPKTAMSAIIIMSAWQAVGYDMAIIIAGLADIPEQLYDAAKVDGAKRLQRAWYVTMPLLRNPLIFVVLTLIMGASQVFTQIYIMTQGGPANSTQVMVPLIFNNAFNYYKMGYACALSWLLFGVIFVFVIIPGKIVKSRQIY